MGAAVFSLGVVWVLGNSDFVSWFWTSFVKLISSPLDKYCFAHGHLLVFSAIYAHKWEDFSGSRVPGAG